MNCSAGKYPNLHKTETLFCKEHKDKSESSCEHMYEHNTCGHDHKHIENHSHQQTDITTHSFVFENPIDISTLKHQLFVLITIQSKDLYRVKGFVFDSKSPTPFLVQSVGKRLIIEPFTNWVKQSKQRSKLVFIGKNLKADGFRKMIERSRINN